MRFTIFLILLGAQTCLSRTLQVRSPQSDAEEDEKLKFVDDKEEEKEEKEPNILANLGEIFGNTIKLVQSVVETKQRILTPLADSASQTVNTIAESRIIDTAAETAGAVADTVIEAKKNVVDAVAGAAPVVLERFGGAIDVAGELMRMGICHVFCPLQRDSDSCKSDHCSQENEVEEYDYEGDYIAVVPRTEEEVKQPRNVKL